MSMIGNFRTTSDADIAALLEQPKRIELLLYGEYLTKPRTKRGFFSLFSKHRHPAPDTWTPHDPGEELDVDKAWHGIHYLLTGSPWEGTGPEAFILAGGQTIGNIDVGYGPARAFPSDEVREIARRLNEIDQNRLKAAWDQKTFLEHKIYPDMWEKEPESCFGYLLEHFEALKRFIMQAADTGKALIVYMN
ncbi:DUF1877 family protein [candidate division KSB3 bacterium]|uniref:DUF1877 family protein n=1 Tax=candidate division KSB3 bacterium TaxID=2044937 RepID=A0A9D5Q7G5_9BACT|nr:DUF1877 family protein [candidate division KSB3 bacterium]MBD3326277.1 DUF1877 family protein [candidate division KSB3 bacterium]